MPAPDIHLLLMNLSPDAGDGAAIAEVWSRLEQEGLRVTRSTGFALAADLPTWVEVVIGVIAADLLRRVPAALRLATDAVKRQLSTPRHGAKFAFDDGTRRHVFRSTDIEHAICDLPRFTRTFDRFLDADDTWATATDVYWSFDENTWHCTVDFQRMRRAAAKGKMTISKLSDADLRVLAEALHERLVVTLGNPRANYFDPGRVLKTLQDSVSLRDEMASRSAIFEMVPRRPIAAPTATTDFEGRGLLTRSQVAAHCDDLTQLLGQWKLLEPEAMPSLEDPRSVFVVSGRNRRAHDAVTSLLRALDLRPREWEELRALTGSSSPFVFEVLQKGFEVARAVIVVLTPDEAVELLPQLRTEAGDELVRHQPRANVLFEAGMAFMKDPARTILVEFGDVLRATDIAGVHSVRVCRGAGGPMRKEIAERLKTAKCDVNMSGSEWLAAGDFDSALDLVSSAR